MTQYGILNEQGDLGIFTELNEKDNTTVNEAVARERGQDQNISVINETQKNK